MIVVSPCPRPVLESRHAPQAHPPHRRSHADARAGGLSPPRLRQPARPAPSSGAQTAARYAGRSHHGLALSLCALRPHVPGLSAGGQPGPHLGAAARRGGDAVRAGPQLRRGQPRAGRPGPPLEQDGGLQRGAGGGDAGAGAAALGADLTSVKCAGQWLTVGVGVDAVHGLALTVDVLENGEAATLTAWIGEIAAAVGATVLVSDDADGFKAAADDTGLEQQVCIAHVTRNTDAWAAHIIPKLAQDADGSLMAIRVDALQAITDVAALWTLIHARQPTAGPRPGERASLAYRLRLFSLDRWNLWGRLTRYRTWTGPEDAVLDGTNNATERAIGWWVKERYRTMRGYKREASITNVSRLIAWAGNQLSGSGADLGVLIPSSMGDGGGARPAHPRTKV